MAASKRNVAAAAALGLLALLGLLAVLAPRMNAQESGRGKAETADDKRWQAVAPGRVEPASGEIRIIPQVIGVVDDLLVKANDKVFAGEALIRLRDSEARARLAGVEVQIALRRRARNDENPSARAAARRRAEDAV
jgi:HlyD family secretion protein